MQKASESCRDPVGSQFILGANTTRIRRISDANHYAEPSPILHMIAGGNHTTESNPIYAARTLRKISNPGRGARRVAPSAKLYGGRRIPVLPIFAVAIIRAIATRDVRLI